MKTMNASEFANYIFNKFPQAVKTSKPGKLFYILKAGCYYVVRVWEPNSGMTKIEINGKSYTKMNAAEKREAVNFIDNLEFDIVTDHDIMSDTTNTFYYLTGTYTEGQEIMCGEKVWRRIEKIVHVK